MRDADCKIIVTGAGGWLGAASLEMLESALGNRFDKTVLAFANSSRALRLRSGASIGCRPLRELANVKPEPALILHYAFVTKDRVESSRLQDFIEQNERINRLLFDFLAAMTDGFVFAPSSGAVYRKDGSIDSGLEQNPYGVMKARTEDQIKGLLEGSRIRLVQPRVFNLSGPFMNKVRSYALGSILSDIIGGRTITIKADHPVIRSYFHVRDLIDLAVAMLLSDAPGMWEPFDTAGEADIEIGDLAMQAAALLGHADAVITRPEFETGAPDRYVGDGRVLSTLMQMYEIDRRPLKEQITDTAEYLMELPGV